MTSSNQELPPQPAGRPSALMLRPSQELALAGGRVEQADANGDDSLDLRELWRMVVRHKWALLASVLLCLLVALVAGLTSTPQFASTVMLQVDRSTARIVEFNKNAADSSEGDDFLQMQTQVELLRSRALADRVIDELGLDPTRGRLSGAPSALLGGKQADAGPGAGDAAAPPPALDGAAPVAPAADKSGQDSPWFSIFASLKSRLLAGYDRMGKPAVDDRQALGREAVVGAFMGSLTVEPVRNSRLIRIRVEDTDPARAARVANSVAQAFISMTLERRVGASVYAKQFLEEQIKVTKAKLEESERELNAYARANSILTLDDKTNVLHQTFSDYSQALARAEQDRVKAETLYNEVSRNPESAPQVLDSKTVEYFKEQKAKLEADYLVNLGTFKPEFPKMQQMKAQIGELDARIKAEVTNVLASVKAQYEAARRQEEQVRARVLETRKEVQASQDRSVDLNLLRRELDTNRQIYDSLLQRLKEVDVTRGVTTNNISVADAAKAPMFPFKPNLLKNAAIGLALGLLLGLGYIFLREHMDDSVKHADEVEAQLGLPLLGVIPQLPGKTKGQRRAPALQSVDDPRGSFAEAYRSMRTALQFSTSEGAPRQLMVTSSVKGEGKSTTSLALAINFAQMGKRVLLVDADMRNPSVHKVFGMPNERGLSNYLSGEGTRSQLIHETEVANLAVLTAGPTPPSPVDLLMGPRLFRLLDKAGEMGFDQVIVDAPPVLGIADAIVLGNQVQAILFVVQAGQTRKSSVKDALRRLRLAGLVPLGAALTRATTSNAHYYGYETYYGYGYGSKEAIGQDKDSTRDDRALA